MEIYRNQGKQPRHTEIAKRREGAHNGMNHRYYDREELLKKQRRPMNDNCTCYDHVCPQLDFANPDDIGKLCRALFSNRAINFKQIAHAQTLDFIPFPILALNADMFICAFVLGPSPRLGSCVHQGVCRVGALRRPNH